MSKCPNQNFFLDADIDLVRRSSLGFEVEDVRDTEMGSAKDKEIIEYALKNNKIIITGDTDFGATTGICSVSRSRKFHQFQQLPCKIL